MHVIFSSFLYFQIMVFSQWSFRKLESVMELQNCCFFSSVSRSVLFCSVKTYFPNPQRAQKRYSKHLYIIHIHLTLLH